MGALRLTPLERAVRRLEVRLMQVGAILESLRGVVDEESRAACELAFEAAAQRVAELKEKT